MFFKLASKNAYRDLIRNARRISISELSDSEKSEAFTELYTLLKPRLGETSRTLNAEAAYAKRCIFQNAVNQAEIKPVCTVRNPWLAFKREFESAIQSKNPSGVSRALAWFYYQPYRDDWLAF
jgi:hypothetical protein